MNIEYINVGDEVYDKSTGLYCVVEKKVGQQVWGFWHKKDVEPCTFMQYTSYPHSLTLVKPKNKAVRFFMED